VTITIRGLDFEENLNNSMGIEFYNLSHRFGYQHPNWPYFDDVKIERIHYMPAPACSPSGSPRRCMRRRTSTLPPTSCRPAVHRDRGGEQDERLRPASAVLSHSESPLI
jgi:hypothetical protein